MMMYSLILLIYIQRRESDFNSRNEYALVISYSTSSIQSLVSFVLAGFVAKVVNEWRIQRQTYGTLVGKSRSFMILACAYIQVYLTTLNPPLEFLLEIKKLLIFSFFKLCAFFLTRDMKGAPRETRSRGALLARSTQARSLHQVGHGALHSLRPWSHGLGSGKHLSLFYSAKDLLSASLV